MEWRARFTAPIHMRFVPLFLGLAVWLRAAESFQISSAETRTHLLELFSSEGCSSCPPAEQWLGGLMDSPGLWRDFVPVSFHVAYWDRLGWPDRFATKAYTNRQYAYSQEWQTNSVYTPEFVLDGLEWLGGRSEARLSPSAEPAGKLTLTLAPDGNCRVTFGRQGRFEVHVAILGGGITSRIEAGENRGRTLHHEFVAMGLTSAPLEAGFVELKLTVPNMAGVTRRGLAAWITRRDELVPLQVVGGWLD